MAIETGVWNLSFISCHSSGESLLLAKIYALCNWTFKFLIYASDFDGSTSRDYTFKFDVMPICGNRETLSKTAYIYFSVKPAPGSILEQT